MDYSITKEKYSALNQGASSTPAAAASDDGDEEEEGERGDGMDVESEDDEEEEEEDGTAGGTDDDSEDEEDGDGAEEPKEGGPDAGAGVGRAVERKQQRAPDVNHGCTIFVRNVAFDSSQEEVKERFSEFGDVRLALLVKDRATGMPRGTAFVKVCEGGRRGLVFLLRGYRARRGAL